MEHRIGEVVTLPDGRKVEVVEGFGCKKCVFAKCICNDRFCSPTYRTDGKNIIYKEVK